MKIFISYARESQEFAESLAARLAAEDHETFFDRTSLPAGDAFDARIRKAIARADLFIFLISPHAVDPSSYARTELEFARSRWPNPSGRVLPVMLEPTPMKSIPPYLATPTFLQPGGNLVAAILAWVEKEQDRRASSLRRRWAIGAAAILAVAAAGAGLRGYLTRPRDAAVCQLTAQLTREDGNTLEQGTVLDVQYRQRSNSYLVDGSAIAIDIGPFEKNESTWTLNLRTPSGESGEEVFKGCMTSEQGVRIGDGYNLSLRPRG